MLKRTIVFGLIAIMLAACSITPKPMSIQERFRIAKKTMRELFRGQSRNTMTIDYYEALARGVKNNLDYRLKLVNIAVQAGQLEVAVFTMFPSLNVTSKLYTRSNEYQVAGITAEGVSTGLSSSTPRTLLTAREAMSWNILDFGMGYVKAKQQSNRVLFAQEETRRQSQQLAQDVLVAYWIAYSAQELLDETRELQRLLKTSKVMLDRAVRDQTVPKENLLNYQASILDGDRKLIQLQYKYDKAMLDLKHLLFLPVDQKIILAAPPRALFKAHDLSMLNLYKMDAVTLVNHPELRGQNYQERIAEYGVSTVILQALPGLTLDYGKNYDSNKFLLNNRWIDKSVDVAWNLLNVASLPANYKTAKAQIQYEKIKSMAMTMAALTETRYAYAHYQTLRREYFITQQQTENANELYMLNQHSSPLKWMKIYCYLTCR
jgi:multidrug efflux system outer membrane protein